MTLPFVFPPGDVPFDEFGPQPKSLRRNCRPNIADYRRYAREGAKGINGRHEPPKFRLKYLVFLSCVFCGIWIIGFVSPEAGHDPVEGGIPPHADQEQSDLLPNANPFPTKLNWP